jgi:hypothetical protein
MAESAEECGCDVFSIHETDGIWYVWFKYLDVKSIDGISTIFVKRSAAYDRLERETARKAKKTGSP